MVELVDTSDLKSDGRKAVRVQFPLRVHNGRLSKDSLSFLILTVSIALIFRGFEEIIKDVQY